MTLCRNDRIGQPCPLRTAVTAFNAVLDAEHDARDREARLTPHACRLFRAASNAYMMRLAAAVSLVTSGRADYPELIEYGRALLHALARLGRDLNAALQTRHSPYRVPDDCGFPPAEKLAL